jgi:hypothetical protein
MQVYTSLRLSQCLAGCLIGLWVLVIVADVWAKPIATGPYSWRDNQTGRESLALGARLPVNYQRADGSWQKINPNWEMVTATTWKVVKGAKHTTVEAGGQAYFISSPESRRHIIGTRTTALIAVDMSDTSWTELMPESGRTGRVRGNRFVFTDLVPGVDKMLIYEPNAYREHFVFQRGLLQRLVAQGILKSGTMLGTATRLDMDSLGLDLVADGKPLIFDGDGTIVPTWVEARDGDSTVWNIAESFLETEDAITDIRVFKWFVQREDGPYMVEMFDAVEALKLKSAVFAHDAWFGNKTTAAANISIEDQIIGSPFLCPFSGTGDSISAYIAVDGVGDDSVLVGFALYEVDSTGGTIVDSSLKRDIPLDEDDGYVWESQVLNNAPDLTGGKYYFLLAWSESGYWGSNLRIVNPSTGDTTSVDLSQTFGAWPTNFTRDYDFISYAAGIYLTYSRDVVELYRRRSLLLRGGH